MTALAIGLVLSAALIHASWNFLSIDLERIEEAAEIAKVLISTQDQHDEINISKNFSMNIDLRFH